ncbi:putative polysaccharide biosynthesis protein [Halalkalibacter urbisdiaboli]|uniref:putative polysaccharide biosynthesis protein n=1 Tax=Halalkalibacter urbisdiaboli TaxID=1960589 RepID=UPI000B43017A|nr:polysaccharide biosynthesis protein [Halalkalibacter urbisdiaboli]
MENDKGQSIWKGAMLLSLTALFAKVLSAGYRIPYQNIAGDLGYYVYQQIYPFYGFVMILAMYGFPVIISKYIAEERAKGNEEGAKTFFSLSFYGLIMFSFGSTVLLFLGAPFLARWIGDLQLTGPLRAVSLTLLLLPFLSSMRGYYQGFGNMKPTAVSHLIEQLVRVCAILLFAYLLLEMGLGAYGAGLGAAYGSLLGGIVSVALLFFFIRNIKNYREWFVLEKIPLALLVQKSFDVFKQSLFICLSALVFILFQFIDVFSLIRLLLVYGYEQEAAFQAKGVYDRGQPLLQLGMVVTTTFSLTLVPLLAKAVTEKRLQVARSYHDLALRLTLLMGGAATIGLFVIIEPTNHMLFTDRLGSDVLSILSWAIIGSTLYVTLSAILQGYGYVHLPAVTLLIGLVIKVVGNVLFVPLFATKGAAMATVFSFAVMVSIQLFMLKRLTGQLFMRLTAYRAVLLTLGCLFITTWVWRTIVELEQPSRFSDSVLALSTVAIGGLTVLLCLLRFNILDETEFAAIPKLSRFRRLILRK